MVSLAAQMPDQRMKRATRAPHQPSICQWRKCPAREPRRTAPVARESLRLSAAVAAMAAEEMRRPTVRL